MDNHLIKKIFEDNHKNNYLDNIRLDRDVSENLLDHQKFHVFNMICALKLNRCVLDSSNTGLGKTYTTIACCKQLNLLPFIICTKTSINMWISILKKFNQSYINVINYESCKSNTYCDYDGKNFLWDFKKIRNKNKIVIIFDEVHKCKNKKSLNGILLTSTKKFNVIMLSATLCDKLEDFEIFGYMLDFYKNIKYGKQWIRSVDYEQKNNMLHDNENNKRNTSNVLYKYIYPDKGSRMTHQDVDCSLMNCVEILCCDSDESVRKFQNKSIDIKDITSTRQIIEIYKTNFIISLIEDYYEKQSIAIFVNFIQSLELITKYLEGRYSYCVIRGSQTQEERKKSIDSFQSNEKKIIICTIQSGGTSISLHDIHGMHPRMSIISPSYNSIELLQTLGRIYRSGSLTPCIQKIIFCSNTYEERIAERLKSKIKNIQTINDDDMAVL